MGKCIFSYHYVICHDYYITIIKRHWHKMTRGKRNLIKVVDGFEGSNTFCLKNLGFSHCLRELVKPLSFQPCLFLNWRCEQDDLKHGDLNPSTLGPSSQHYDAVASGSTMFIIHCSAPWLRTQLPWTNRTEQWSYFIKLMQNPSKF